MTLTDLFTLISFVGPAFAAFQTAKSENLSFFWVFCSMVGGFAIGFCCAWLLRVAFGRVALVCEILEKSHRRFAVNAIGILFLGLAVVWLFVSIALGDWLAREIAPVAG